MSPKYKKNPKSFNKITVPQKKKTKKKTHPEPTLQTESGNQPGLVTTTVQDQPNKKKAVRNRKVKKKKKKRTGGQTYRKRAWNGNK